MAWASAFLLAAGGNMETVQHLIHWCPKSVARRKKLVRSDGIGQSGRNIREEIWQQPASWLVSACPGAEDNSVRWGQALGTQRDGSNC